MEKQLINILKNVDVGYIKIPSIIEIERIYKMFKNNLPIIPITITEKLYLGVWYQQQNDQVNMKKYYLMAIDAGNSSAMNNLGCWYQQQNDQVNMKKYYLMAIDAGNSTAMNNLGYWYQQQNDEENMKKYYLMAIDAGNSSAMNNLGYWYHKQNDEENMKKYYLMAIDAGNSVAMYNLGWWYQEQNDNINALKLYNDCINNTNYLHDTHKKIFKRISKIFDRLKKDELTEDVVKILCELDFNKFNNVPVFLFLAQQLYKSKINLLNLHFNYSPDAVGATDAKNDFLINIKSNLQKNE